jgi:class 3 adenylate cyclase/streptogramin lyase
MGRRAADRSLAAALFTDIVGSTEIASELGDARWRVLITNHHEIVRRALKRFGGRERDTAGDGFFATFTIPADAVRCAVVLQREVRELGIEIRAGVHFGQVETVDGKPGGLVVVGAARIMSESGPGTVLVSSSVRDVLPGAGISFDDAGDRHLKGLDGEMRLYRVTAVDDEPVEPPDLDPAAARRRRDEIVERDGQHGRRSSRVAAAIAAGVLLVAGLFAVTQATGKDDDPTAPVGPPDNALVGIDPATGNQELVIPVELQLGRYAAPRTAGHIGAAGEGGIWLVRDSLLLHVDPEHEEVVDPPVNHASWVANIPIAIDIGGDRLWASTGEVFTIDGSENRASVFAKPDIGTSVYGVDMTVGGKWIWVADTLGTLWRVDPEDGTDIRSVRPAGGQIDAVVADAGSVWVYDSFESTVIRVDPASLEPDEALPAPTGLAALAMFDGTLWMLSGPSGTLGTLDPSNVAQVGANPVCLAAGLGSLWVGDENGDVHRVDPLTFESEVVYRAGGPVRAVIPDEDRELVWLDVGSNST